MLYSVLASHLQEIIGNQTTSTYCNISSLQVILSDWTSMVAPLDTEEVGLDNREPIVNIQTYNVMS